MSTFTRMVTALLLIGVPVTSAAEAPTFAPRLRPERTNLPVGNWQIEFENGVVETCEIRADGWAYVREPLRRSPGKAVMRDGAAVITCEDDRIERWTKVDGRMVVEHWCPVSSFPDGSPVKGIARSVR